MNIRRMIGWTLVGTVALVIAGASVAQAAERSLGGIRVFTPVKTILKRFGDPSFISTGASLATYEYGTEQVIVIPPGQMGGGFGGGMGTGGGAGYGPMGYGMPGAMGGTGVAGANAAQTDPELTFTAPNISRYYYLTSHGVTYEFILSPNGRVLGIDVTGYHGHVRTSRGITLGSTYAQVEQKYGYPESQSLEHRAEADVLTATYINRDHVSFRFVHGKVVSIIVTAAE